MEIKISVLGTCLVDYLYSPVNFNDAMFKRFSYKIRGDGGLEPGKLVFTEDFESFSGLGVNSFLYQLTGIHFPSVVNIGGPAIVAAINAAQILGERGKILYFGLYGNDEVGRTLRKLLNDLPVNLDWFSQIEGETPCTFVLSDPGYNNGSGERTFINRIGTSWSIIPELIPEDFFASDILFFGATAVLPHIHGSLDGILEKGRANGALNVISTVFDFLSEKKDPSSRWPLGESLRTYSLTDLLIADREEALGLSGCITLSDAAIFFINMGLDAFLITQGSDDVYVYSSGARFRKLKPMFIPVSERAKSKILNAKPDGFDTTGCGDNFAGGVLASIAMQLKKGNTKKLNLLESCAWGMASGGIACFYMGGVFRESEEGEKRILIEEYYSDYVKQVGQSIK